jgi:hypothetical protein
MGFVNPITLMNNKFGFTYAPLIRSEENSRKALGTVRFTFTLSVVIRTFFVVAALSSSAVCVAKAQDDTGAGALARLRTLAGEWEGTFEWTGSRTSTGTMNATYYLTGNSSAVVENLTMGGVPTMTSVYHLDGADLRMTHYCAAGNQPRLKAERIDIAKGTVDFSFIDATNLPSLSAPHVHGLEIRFLDTDHISLTYLFQSGSKESRERIALTRVKSPHARQPPSAAAPRSGPVSWRGSGGARMKLAL